MFLQTLILSFLVNFCFENPETNRALFSINECKYSKIYFHGDIFVRQIEKFE